MLPSTIQATDYHTGGEPFRIVADPPVPIPGRTVAERRARAIEDPALVAELAQRAITLECCPTSNVVLGVFSSYEQHPLKRLADAGVRVTLGSDDPPYFGASIGGEYDIAQQRLGFDEAGLKAITTAAIEAAFCEDSVKTALSAKL